MRRPSKQYWIVAVILIFQQTITQSQKYAPCSNLCSGHGKCQSPYSICSCLDGFTGADCSLRICPVGNAWTDIATADETAHALNECSNRGICDRTTGICICHLGFEGIACERKSCPGATTTSGRRGGHAGFCNKKGRCVSARALATLQDPGTLRRDEGGGCTSDVICEDDDCTIRNYSNCAETLTYELAWEADKFYGCLCDEGYTGYDCSRRTCARGDDPLTGSDDGDVVQTNEIQFLECQATFGTFTLSFLGYTTVPISVDANVFEFVDALSSLNSIKHSGSSNPKILVQWLSGSETVCTPEGNDIQITFLQNFGDLPLILPDGSNLGHISVSQTPLVTNQKLIPGDKESDDCSNRGTCDTDTGVCSCLEDWMTSDGYGDPGTRGDCGHRFRGTTSTCPGEPACLGYGTCSGPPEYRCACQNGRFGPDCALMSCPKDKSWFSFPNEDNVAHGLAECSDMGTCDFFRGTCDCAEGFTGAACELMECPGDPMQCNGNGECLSMTMLALKAHVNGDPVQYTYGSIPNDHLRWDFDQMRGCYCSEGWEGYDCSLKSCPKGDDPRTPHQFNEVQHFTCTDSDDDGTFRLIFRGKSTASLRATDTASDLQSALNDLPTIKRVSVKYGDPDIYVGAPSLDADSLQLCRASTQVIAVEFESPTGDVPMLQIDDVDGIDDTDIVVTEDVKGTKEYVTCSGRGLCDHITGLCRCFTGFASSDGQGNAGVFGDCGYKSPVELPSSEYYY